MLEYIFWTSWVLVGFISALLMFDYIGYSFSDLDVSYFGKSFKVDHILLAMVVSPMGYLVLISIGIALMMIKGGD